MDSKRRARATLVALGSAIVAGCGGGGAGEVNNVAMIADPPADTFALTTANRLVSFARGAPAIASARALTGLQAGENVLGIDIRPGGTPAGAMIALGSTGRLYTIDTSTGVATQRAMLAADPTDTTSPFTALDGTSFGVDFNPVPDRFRVISNTGQNLRINADTGATITDATLTVAGATAMGVTGAAYTNVFAAACRTTLFYIDATGDRVLTAADPNAGVLTVVGALGVDAGVDNAFDVQTETNGTNSAFAALTVGGVTSLYTINTTTGAATSSGAITGLNAGEGIRALAVSPLGAAPAQAQGDLLAVTETNRLLSFTSGAPQKACTNAAIAGLQAGENVLGIDMRPADGSIVALGSTGRVYTIAPATAAATLRSTLAADAADTTSPFTTLAGAAFGVDVNPVPDRFRVVSDTGVNLRINMDTGATTTDAILNPAGSTVTAVAYTNTFAGAGSTTLYVLDIAGDRLMIQGQPSGNPNNGDLLAVGALGVDAQAVSGFDIDGRNSTAFAALNVGTATTSDLYTINLATGAATRVNTIGGGERVRGLVLAANPVVNLVGITDDARVVSFRVATPGTLDTNVALTGLQGGENVVGADRRPANGRFFALTDAARLYTLDAVTGVATLGASLAADAADTTNPFTTLSGPLFGVDFNPVPDRMRVVSNAEQNLRINVDTGATTTDTNLVRGPFSVSAAAYTNNFVGATTTTLYVIDTQNDRLLTQVPPNNGTLNDIGALGLDVTSVNGFEIVGPDTALAAFETATAPAGLYTINLTSGAATLVGAIGLAMPADRLTALSAAASMATPAADSTVIAVVNGNALVSFARNLPATVSAPVAITGLAMGETLRGADIRPANGLLYGLGTAGGLYSIDTATGAATLVGTVATNPAGTALGVDVNPTVDRLRVVSNLGENLRYVMDTAAVAGVDIALNFAGPDAIGAGYARNFAGTTTTTLYVVDIATNTLQIQNPPNDGVQVTVGRLDPAVTFTAGAFDIAGGDDGLALAALVPTAGSQSTLYRVNLRTGAATALGAIGPAGTMPIRALMIELR